MNDAQIAAKVANIQSTERIKQFAMIGAAIFIVVYVARTFGWLWAIASIIGMYILAWKNAH